MILEVGEQGGCWQTGEMKVNLTNTPGEFSSVARSQQEVTHAPPIDLGLNL